MGKRKKKRRVSWILIIPLVIVTVYYCTRKEEKHIDLTHIKQAPIPDGFSVLGIDVSHHNGDIDWEAVKAQGVSFAYIKATEGESITDKNYDSNYQSAKENGLTAGMYHFFLFKKDGAEQASFFLKKLQYEKGDLPPVVDVEYSPWNIRNLKKAKERVRELVRFDSVVYKELAIHPIIYTNKECYEDLIRDRFPENDLWLCDLSDIPDDDSYPNWIFWQHNHKGKLTGVDSKVDMNVFYAGKEDFEEWLNCIHKKSS